MRACPYCGTDARHLAADSPLADAERTSRLGLGVIAFHVVLYFLMVTLDPARGEEGREALSPSHLGVTFWGATHPWLIGTGGQYWRLATAIFLHLDLMHLLFNCVSLYVLLPHAATTFGRHRTATIYLGAGLLAALGSHLAGNGGAGASGAICGLITAMAAWGRRRSGRWDNDMSRRMLFWAIFILGYGYLRPGIDNAAHGVGFGVGLLLGWAAAGVRAWGGREDRAWMWSSRALAALVLVAFGGFQIPSVLRSFDRREMELYAAEVQRAMQSLSSQVEGDRSLALPATIPDGPRGSERVRDALRDAVAAVREGRASEARIVSTYEVVAEWYRKVSLDYLLDPGG